MAGVDRNVFLKEYSEALLNGSAAMFVGAGASQPAGFVNWKELLKEIAEELKLDVDRETDLVALAQYYWNHRGNRNRLNQILVEEFLKEHSPTITHRKIATLPLHTVWTTNYDGLLEQAFKEAGKRVDIKRRSSDFGITVRRASSTIYKMHGDKDEVAEAVLAKDDYETYNPKREVFTIALKGDLTLKTFLFIGISFTDPNLSYILSRVRQLVDINGRQHFALLKSPKPGDENVTEYDVNRFSHWLSDLKRYNIQPVLLDNYGEVPQLLEELNRRSNLRDIFLSGSAADFQPFGEAKLRTLCQALGRALIEQGFNLISGFGVGIGGDIIIGAMRALGRNDDERLQLRPFPQDIADPVDRAKFWTGYRERMIADAGICIVISGNKLANGQVEPAAGVKEEIEIARKQRKFLIPIGATGFVAADLWQELSNDLKTAFDGRDILKSFNTLGEVSASVDQLVAAVIDIVKKLNK
jgi:hypothetical protein